MKSKKNVNDLCRDLNLFIDQNQKKTFTSAELVEELKKIGFNKNMAYAVAISNFPSEKMGSSKLYNCPKEHILNRIIVGLFSKQREKANNYAKERKEVKSAFMTEEQAIQLLVAKGYRIQKPIGFDIDKFYKDNPTLYAKYMAYEDIK